MATQFVFHVAKDRVEISTLSSGGIHVAPTHALVNTSTAMAKLIPYGEITTARLKELGRSWGEAATKAGLKKTFYYDLIRGKKRGIGAVSMAQFAKGLDWTPADLEAARRGETVVETVSVTLRRDVFRGLLSMAFVRFGGIDDDEADRIGAVLLGLIEDTAAAPPAPAALSPREAARIAIGGAASVHERLTPARKNDRNRGP